MRGHSRFQWAGTLPFALTLATLLPAAALGEKLRNHFDSDAFMREPAFFDFVALGAPGETSWKVVAEFNPPSAPNAISQVVSSRPAESIGAALRRTVTLRDGTLLLGIKKTPGIGGIVFRLADEKNYLAVLIDPVTGQARLLQSRAGRTTELARATSETPREWGVLTVELSGSRVAAAWEGKPLFEAQDAAPAAGRVGIATAGPGIMTFDEFVIDGK
ncbi:MAG: hypothetical protein M3S32_09280 [Acidobacteriota bacterium]|nr:hypothetical protein [Acidobacteriota bacterium]